MLIERKKYTKANNAGYALITVLLIMVVLSVLFVSAYGISQNNINQIVHQENNLRAHYLARSGATFAYTAIAGEIDGVTLLNKFGPNNYEGENNAMKDTIEFEEEKAEVYIKAWYNKDNGNIYIESKSTLNDYSNTSQIFLKFEKNNPEVQYWLNKLD